MMRAEIEALKGISDGSGAAAGGESLISIFFVFLLAIGIVGALIYAFHQWRNPTKMTAKKKKVKAKKIDKDIEV